jgi:hypothetical protein
LIPHIEALNEACPKSEWNEDFNGNPRGPWAFQTVVYLVDENMGKISYPTGTTGGGMCVRELADKVTMTRKFRGAHVYPVVTVSTKWMPTRFGGRNRPAFDIKRWISFGNGPAVLEEPTAAPALPNSTATDMKTAGAHIVSEVSVAEELNDEIKF